MNWPLAALSTVAQPVSRPVSVTPGQKYRQIGVRLWGEGAYERETIDGSETAANTLSLVKADDLIINKIWVRNGSAAVASSQVDGCAASGEFPTFTLNPERIVPSWLHWMTKTRDFWHKCDALSQGTSGKNRIKPERFLTIEVPLPPIEEQRRVVARVDAIASRVAEARRLREEGDAQAAAVIHAERNAMFSSLAEETPAQPLVNVAQCRLGKMVSGNRSELEGVPYLRNANVRWDHFDLSSIYRIVVTERERSELLLKRGDLLVCEGRHLGKCAIWNEEIAGCIFQKALHRIRVDPERVHPRFLYHHMAWSAERGDFTEIHSTSTIPHLTGKMLKKHPVFIPSLEEQRRIVAHLDALQAKLDTVRAAQSETAAELDALLPSVLNRAFAGEL